MTSLNQMQWNLHMSLTMMANIQDLERITVKGFNYIQKINIIYYLHLYHEMVQL